jgi:hypothetical protein
MNNLDIDELMEFINNKSQKKDDSSKPQGSQKRVSSNTKACSLGQQYEGSTLET